MFFSRSPWSLPYPVRVDELALQLAREARRLNLSAGATHAPEALAAFAELVLTELAARGLIADECPEIACWAALRPPGN